jgi:hypothetical protein
MKQMSVDQLKSQKKKKYRVFHSMLEASSTHEHRDQYTPCNAARNPWRFYPVPCTAHVNACIARAAIQRLAHLVAIAFHRSAGAIEAGNSFKAICWLP